MYIEVLQIITITQLLSPYGMPPQYSTAGCAGERDCEKLKHTGEQACPLYVMYMQDLHVHVLM